MGRDLRVDDPHESAAAAVRTLGLDRRRRRVDVAGEVPHLRGRGGRRVWARRRGRGARRRRAGGACRALASNWTNDELAMSFFTILLVGSMKRVSCGDILWKTTCAGRAGGWVGGVGGVGGGARAMRSRAREHLLDRRLARAACAHEEHAAARVRGAGSAAARLLLARLHRKVGEGRGGDGAREAGGAARRHHTLRQTWGPQS